MKNVVELLRRFHQGHSDVLAVDFASSCTKAVRMKKGKKEIVLLAADLLPRAAMPAPSETGAPASTPFEVPKSLRARYVSLAAPGDGAIVKLLNIPGPIESAGATQLNDLMGLGEASANYRMAYEQVGRTHGRPETKLLAVALLESQAQWLLQQFPHGTPAPCSIEISGLASMTAFLHGPGRDHAEDCVMVADFGARFSMVAIFNKGVLMLVRKIDTGTDTILSKVQENLGVDAATAEGILVDGAFDISQAVKEVLGPFTQQLVVSRDFVERRENCHVKKIYACGGITGSRDWLAEMRSAMGLEADRWNPFDALTVAPGAIPDSVKGRESGFAAAVGAGLATFEET